MTLSLLKWITKIASQSDNKDKNEYVLKKLLQCVRANKIIYPELLKEIISVCIEHNEFTKSTEIIDSLILNNYFEYTDDIIKFAKNIIKRNRQPWNEYWIVSLFLESMPYKI